METFGAQLRAWRLNRRFSQEALAARAGVSTRHLSFVETGRATPSRDLVLALAGALEVPLREHNTLLTAAGYAAVFRATPLAATELSQLRRAIDAVLAQQEPFGAVVVDASWNLLRANRGATRLLQALPPQGAAGLAVAGNLLLATLHREALGGYVVNWAEVAEALVSRLHRQVAARPEDEGLRQLLARVLALPGVPRTWRVPVPGRTDAPFLAVHLRGPSLEVRLFTLLTSIGTPLDVTAEELHVEVMFPADAPSEAALRGLAETAPA
jgi:transcriptional regulator with XRE-family HTH domain